MILTVAELRKALDGLPETLPVRIDCAKTYYGGEDACCPEESATDYADGVQFQGNHVLITCPD